jgi:hypothetical protein
MFIPSSANTTGLLPLTAAPELALVVALALLLALALVVALALLLADALLVGLLLLLLLPHAATAAAHASAASSPPTGCLIRITLPPHSSSSHPSSLLTCTDDAPRQTPPSKPPTRRLPGLVHDCDSHTSRPPAVQTRTDSPARTGSTVTGQADSEDWHSRSATPGMMRRVVHHRDRPLYQTYVWRQGSAGAAMLRSR